MKRKIILAVQPTFRTTSRCNEFIAELSFSILITNLGLILGHIQKNHGKSRAFSGGKLRCHANLIHVSLIHAVLCMHGLIFRCLRTRVALARQTESTSAANKISRTDQVRDRLFTSKQILIRHLRMNDYRGHRIKTSSIH